MEVWDYVNQIQWIRHKIIYMCWCEKDVKITQILLIMLYDYGCYNYGILPSGQNRQKKQSEVVRILLIQHSKYSAMLSKIHSYRMLFFGDFAH